MFQLLIVAGSICLAIGDLGEALMLLGFATVNVLTAVHREYKAERVLEALRDLTSPTFSLDAGSVELDQRHLS